jgi:hypothetical protein
LIEGKLMMKLVGNEKRIQALFLELKREDERAAPGFGKVWNPAQVTTSRQGHAFKVSFALAMILLALSTLVLWWRNWERGQQLNPIIAGQPTRPESTPSPSTATLEPKTVGVVEGLEEGNREKPNRLLQRRSAHQSRLRALRHAEIRNASAISGWQSPTARLLQSPADDVLTSLPQLDQYVMEFRSFLPNTPE